MAIFYSTYILVMRVNPLKESFETRVTLFLFKDLQGPNKGTSVNVVKDENIKYNPREEEKVSATGICKYRVCMS